MMFGKFGNYSRRQALVAMGLGLASSALTGPAPGRSTSVRSRRLSIADGYVGRVKSPLDMIKRRLSAYSNLGIGVLRSEIGWRLIEAQPTGGLNFDQDWFREAQQAGFRLKLVIGSLSAAPGWFLAKYPEASIRNQRGETITGVLSPWWPGLSELLAEKADEVFTAAVELGLMANTDSIIVDLGPAAEPIYPATIFDSYWFFDKHATTAFAASMKSKYNDSLDRANHVWATSYAKWSDITLPIPPMQPGKLWEDILLWYRDSKRSLVTQQLRLYKSLARKHSLSATHKLIIFLPGQHLPPGTWATAVANGDGPQSIRIMEDTEFLLDIAKREACCLQITGCEVTDEDHYIKTYLRRRRYDIPVWAENAGGTPANDPIALAKAILANDLFGFEYIDGTKIVSQDGSPHEPTYSSLKTACKTLGLHWGYDA